MSARKPISKKARFEVFKRDLFTCQYCGEKAPDVVLHVDHIKPVAKGGKNDILNLITACVNCNSGKGARTLDDRSAVVRQRAQLEELEVRREQLEMMLQWRDTAERERLDAIQAVVDRIIERSVYEPNERGRNFIRRWIKRYGLDEVLGAIDDSFDQNLDWRDKEPTNQSWELAFKKVPAFVRYRREAITRPYLQKLAYIQGILRKRLENPSFRCIAAMEEWLLDGRQPLSRDQALEVLESQAKRAADWEHFIDLVIDATADRDPMVRGGGNGPH